MEREKRLRIWSARRRDSEHTHTTHWSWKGADYLCRSRNRVRCNTQSAMLLIWSFAGIKVEVCRFLKAGNSKEQKANGR